VKINFGESEREYVCINVQGYECADVRGEYMDDNWLVVDAAVSVGEFRGHVRSAMLTSELVRFSEQLHELYQNLTGVAEFLPMEGELALKLSGDGRGHIHLEGELVEYVGSCCRLSFRLSFDQTQLQTSLRELDSVVRAFPVRPPTA
jgi:hypothetical protein